MASGRLRKSHTPCWRTFLCSEMNFRQILFSETQDSRRHRRGAGCLYCYGKSEKRSPGPSPTTYPPSIGLRLHFYTFVIRGRRLSIGKAEERGFFYDSSSRNGDERHLR